ncbi:TIGR03364 family FAD-dependent oxidoreductase [Arcicella sp. LKC2W]|uniref:TIGR03364 family FAD-dependent oxidoreductase n=1 Tax=Arcicella sp. LKC2W TaxID=2984198 RepID=UPI002B1EB0D9|nr:TIGR03364 family FAD-dependent oxidoreductase [Arcicella sp. LKC2W]MEA5460930.1 TIGR03364 family FAD-dependent oxidoreductase [Arcicella sp. LKC2W]
MKKYDLVVVGSGTLGTFHAYHALLKGKTVLLIEKDSEPIEATVRNFGQVVPSGQALETWFEYGRESLNIYKSIQAKTDITVRQNGSYYFASDDEEMALLEETRALFKLKNYTSTLLPKKSCYERFPTLNTEYYKGGLFFPDEISVEPRTMIHRVRQMLIQHHGLHFMNNTVVKGCEIKNDICEISTAGNETIYAEKVAICNGYEFKILFPEVFKESKMKICKLNMMQTFPLPEVKLNGNILSGLSIRRYDSFKSCNSYPFLQTPEWQKPYNTWGIHILFKQAINGSIIIGDSHEYAGVDENAKLPIGIDMEINELILKEAKRMLNLPNWKIQNFWAGYYAQAEDGGVFEHQINNKIFISTGIGGKGMTTGAGYSRKRIDEIFK